MESSLQGQCAIVTGGARGIGLAYGEALAARGTTVAIADLDLDAAIEAAEKIQAHGGAALPVAVDMADAAAIEAMVSQVKSDVGRIDILVNNAGAHLSTYNQPAASIDIELWRRALDINVTGALLAVRECVPSMREQGGGVVVNQASISAFSATTTYGVSKMALLALTTALSHELAKDGIRVNAIAPGLVDSPAAVTHVAPEVKEAVLGRQSIKRMGRVEDLVGAMLFLCGPESSFMTGQTLVIDGGCTLRP